MAVTLIVGKPGSGKSYFAVSKIADALVDWCAFEKREGKAFERGLYTNLYLNNEELQKYVDARGGDGVDVSQYLHHLEDEFFYDKHGDSPRVPKKWWEDIPNGALLVIDEVHQYLPASGTGARDYMQLFTEYIATHRHREQDLILITQHTDTIHRSILCMAGDVYHILNIKNRVLPWLNIPFADLDVIKEAWGCKKQVANVLYGNYVGRSLKLQNETTILLKSEIFALYKSHTLTDGGCKDRPDLKLSRLGSIWWFTRKHSWHLAIKLGLVVGLFYGIKWFVGEAPRVFSEAISKNMNVQSPTVEKPSLDPNSAAPPSADTPQTVVVPAVVQEPTVAPPVRRNQERYPSNAKDDPEPKKRTLKEEAEDDFFNRSGIYIYGVDFIVTKTEGRINVGEVFQWRGVKSVLVSVDARYKKIVCEPVGTDVPALPSILPDSTADEPRFVQPGISEIGRIENNFEE